LTSGLHDAGSDKKASASKISIPPPFSVSCKIANFSFPDLFVASWKRSEQFDGLANLISLATVPFAAAVFRPLEKVSFFCPKQARATFP
jgi:hypothetical protein